MIMRDFYLEFNILVPLLGILLFGAYASNQSPIDATSIQKIPLGGTGTIECNINDFPLQSMSWKFRGRPIKNDPRYTLTGTGLTISDVTYSDAGLYQCSALSVEGEQVSLNIRVGVQISNFVIEPLSLHAPETQYLEQHDSGLIECYAFGTPTPEISWRRNGRRIMIDDGKYTQTNNGLMVNDINKDDAGLYSCRAEVASQGTFQSTEIDVIVYDILDYRLTIEPSTPMIMRPVDSSLILKCSVSTKSNEMKPEIKWTNPQKQEINSDFDRIHIEEDGMTSKLVIDTLKSYDTGLWSCGVTIGKRGMTKNTNIIVIEPLTFEHAPSPQTFEQHDLALIECQVSGSPKPVVSWRYNGRKIVDDDKYTQSGTGLTIHNIKSGDAGTYQCRAEISMLGVFEFREIEVVVNDVLDFQVDIIPPTPIMSRAIGSAMVLKCSVNVAPEDRGGSVQPEIQWITPAGNVVNDVNGRIYIEDQVFEMKLYIVELKAEDAGLWTCTVSAGSRRLEKNINLILSKPITFDYAPTQQTLEEGGSALIKCRVSGSPQPEISWKYNGIPLSPGDKYEMEQDGLRVKDISVADSGTYQCIAAEWSMGLYESRDIEVLVMSSTR